MRSQTDRNFRFISLIPEITRQPDLPPVSYTHLRSVQEFLEKQLKVFKENCVSRKGEKLLIRTEPFQSGDKILREMTVLSCMEEVAGQAKDLSAVHVADVSTLFGTVSYTHLDVYKRQGCNRCNNGAV